ASRGLSLWTEVLDTARNAPSGKPEALSGVRPFWPPAGASPLAGPLAGMWWLSPGALWWMRTPSWTAWSKATLAGGTGALTPASKVPSVGKAPIPATPPIPADAAVASYRSAGGHAVAQVIIGKMNGRADSQTQTPPNKG